jgi:hypothetical protein
MRIIVPGETQQAAQDKLYSDYPELRGVVRWLFEAPSQKRPDEPKPTIIDPADHSHAATVYKSLMKRYHSDAHPGVMFTADQIVAALNELWLSMRAK